MGLCADHNQKRGADDNWYFLSPRSRRYPGGDRPTRRTADNRGRWKPSTGQSKPGAKANKGPRKNLSVGAIEFTENTLAYYVGEAKNENETKTKWLMHELTVPELDKEKAPESAAAEQPRDHMLVSSLGDESSTLLYTSAILKFSFPGLSK